MKETYQVFIGDSEVADSAKAHEDFVAAIRNSDKETRKEVLSEIAEKIKTKDGRSVAEQALDSLEVVTSPRPSVATSSDSDLRKDVLTTLVQDKKEKEKSFTEGGFFITFNEDGEIIDMGVSSKSSDYMPESRQAAISKAMSKVPSGPKQNRTSFRRGLDKKRPNDK